VLDDVPIRWRNLNEGLSARVTPITTTVTVRGGRDALDAMRAETIDAFVDLAGLGPGQYNLRVQFDPTESFGVAATEPAFVQVTIK
jgi:YbbR domain-containing protein